FTQGIAWGIGFEGYASSPSFVLVREYRGRLNLYHADLYRLDNVEEIADLGLDDYLDGPGILVVEWANKALDSFPPEHLRIHFEHMTENERRLRFEPHGPRYQRLVEQLMTGISTDCHSRESGNPLPSPLDSCLRRNDTEGKNWNFR
ncbi:MAG: tRNA (adenosine(37)-N6)-threonylcarbamoyltransferase complex ATPase subunit type 1 TsaE, partial [Chloroflexi bacterium]|nr:tRNA (adenosine(37)-N6)-threonylcarbamoyltransferase complex ATPase subunit type 1 TsaE [Chloroflexota bacterium]